MKIERLSALRPWQLMLALIGLGIATAVVAWGLIWVVWTIRPILAAVAAFVAVGWLLYALHRHRRSKEWSGQEWLGS